MHETLEEEVQHILATMDGKHTEEETIIPEKESEPEEIYHVYRVQGGVYILKEEEEDSEHTQVIDSVPAKRSHDYVTVCIVLMCCLPILSSITFQVYLMFNPPTVSVTLMPRSQSVTLSGTLKLGRLLSPLTLSQSQTTPTTGRGHQDAKAAQGTITFYNGLFNSQTVATGTILTGSDGVQVITDQVADIPPGNPPSYGQITVSAHTLISGIKGNLPAYDINQACCAVSVLAKNTQPFTGGQDERDFQIVAKSDIGRAASPLKTTLAQGVSGAFQGQLKPLEQLSLLPCTPTVISDHSPGQEAAIVKVTVSETCSAVAYSSQAVTEKATKLLSTQALQKLGTGYRLIGDVQVSIKEATVTHTTTPHVFVSFHAQGIWVYAVNNAEQQHIKNVIAGKTKQAAMHFLRTVPGIVQVSMQWSNDTKLPKDPRNIYLVLIYGI
jgi:hypothetical protein